MAKQDAKIKYDFEEDILDLSKGKASINSIEIGDFIVDVDSEGFVSSIEILNASENLGIDKKILNTIKNAKMRVLYKPNYLFVIILFNFNNMEKEFRIPLTIDLGHREIQKQEIIFA